LIFFLFDQAKKKKANYLSKTNLTIVGVISNNKIKAPFELSNGAFYFIKIEIIQL